MAVSNLVRRMEREESTAHVDSRLEALEAKDEAKALSTGTSDRIGNSSLNGKSWAMIPGLSLEESISACYDALDEYKGSAIAATQADFRCMPR